MQNVTENDHAPAIHEYLTPQQKLQDVEELANELKRLLVHHEVALDEEGVRRELEILERWMESYRRGLAAANKISETGMDWLYGLRDRLKLAAEDRMRLEGEGGNPASSEQAKKTDALFEAAKRIEKAIPEMEQIFSHTQAPENA